MVIKPLVDSEKKYRMDSFCRKKYHRSKEMILAGFVARTYQNNSFLGTLTVGQYTFGSEWPSTVAGLGFVS